MLEVLRNLALSVSGIVLFGSLCEMILPNGAYKKYIHLSIGLVLIIAIVSPLIAFDKVENDVYVELDDMEEAQRNDVLKLYKKNLALNIKKEIEGIAGVEFDIKCEVYDTDEEFGKIKDIQIIIKSGTEISEEAIERIKEKYTRNITVRVV